MRSRVSAAAGSGTGSGNGNSHGGDECPDPVELIVYVKTHSDRSANAITNIKQALLGYKTVRVALTICDLSQGQSPGIPDIVAFPPTPVKRSTGPRTFILGHTTSPELLLELLEGCEPG